MHKELRWAKPFGQFAFVNMCLLRSVPPYAPSQPANTKANNFGRIIPLTCTPIPAFTRRCPLFPFNLIPPACSIIGWGAGCLIQSPL